MCVHIHFYMKRRQRDDMKVSRYIIAIVYSGRMRMKAFKNKKKKRFIYEYTYLFPCVYKQDILLVEGRGKSAKNLEDKVQANEC